jgi:hypothetical protein
MDELEKRDIERTIDARLGFCKSRYEETGNPLFVWLAILHAEEDTRPLETWIKKYLVIVAEDLLKIENPGKQTSALIRDALGFKSGNLFFQFHSSWKKAVIHDHIHALKATNPKKIKDHSIYEDAWERFKITPDLEKKYYEEEKKWKDRITEDE